MNLGLTTGQHSIPTNELHKRIFFRTKYSECYILYKGHYGSQTKVLCYNSVFAFKFRTTAPLATEQHVFSCAYFVHFFVQIFVFLKVGRHIHTVFVASSKHVISWGSQPSFFVFMSTLGPMFELLADSSLFVCRESRMSFWSSFLQTVLDRHVNFFDPANHWGCLFEEKRVSFILWVTQKLFWWIGLKEAGKWRCLEEWKFYSRVSNLFIFLHTIHCLSGLVLLLRGYNHSWYWKSFEFLQEFCLWSYLRQFYKLNQEVAWYRGSWQPKRKDQFERTNRKVNTKISSKSVGWSTLQNSWSQGMISSVLFSSFFSSETGIGFSKWYLQ